MENYDLTKIDIFTIPDLKRGELAQIHSLLLFLYNKMAYTPEISFKYSEITWMNYNSVHKTLTKLSELELISIIKRPKKYSPISIHLKTNAELQYILNKNKRIEFEKYKDIRFTEAHLKEVIGCSNISEHFISTQIPSWLRNINSKSWDLFKFLTIVKIVSYFKLDYKAKTFTVNKYTAKSVPLFKSIHMLYDKIPDNRKEILYNQFNNTLMYHQIKHNKSFVDMVSKYLNKIKKGASEEAPLVNSQLM